MKEPPKQWSNYWLIVVILLGLITGGVWFFTRESFIDAHPNLFLLGLGVIFFVLAPVTALYLAGMAASEAQEKP